MKDFTRDRCRQDVLGSFTKKELASLEGELFMCNISSCDVDDIFDWIKQHDKRLLEEIKKRLPEGLRCVKNIDYGKGFQDCLSEIKQLLK